MCSATHNPHVYCIMYIVYPIRPLDLSLPDGGTVTGHCPGPGHHDHLRIPETKLKKMWMKT